MKPADAKPASTPGEPTSATSRLEAFSDGVFAIAITLLILDVKAPEVGTVTSSANLWHTLAGQWPGYVGYLMSFLVIGITWVDHHLLFNYIRRSDRVLLLLNLLLLMGVAFVPFPTALLSRSLQGKAGQDVAAFVYSGTLLASGIAFNTLWWYASRRNPALLDPTVSPQQVRTLTRRSLIWPLVYLASMGLTYYSVEASLIIYLLLPLGFLVPNAADRF